MTTTSPAPRTWTVTPPASRTIVYPDREFPGRGWATVQVQRADGSWQNLSVTRVRTSS